VPPTDVLWSHENIQESSYQGKSHVREFGYVSLTHTLQQIYIKLSQKRR